VPQLVTISAASTQFCPYSADGTALITQLMTANRAIFVPFCPGNDMTLTRLLMAVTTLLAGTAYMGIYNNVNTAGVDRPFQKIIGSAGMSTATAAQVSATVGSTTLVKGTVYWLCITCSSAATLRAVSTGAVSTLLGFVASATTARTHIYATIAGALPADASALTYTQGSGNVPALFVGP
jgi:hypothetical protein